MFSPSPVFFLSASPSLWLCSPALRQLILPDGSGSTWVESPCLEAGSEWPWRPHGSIPLSRPSHKPFSVGNPWATRCATVPWNGVGAAGKVRGDEGGRKRQSPFQV